jgi:hypothetical protein
MPIMIPGVIPRNGKKNPVIEVSAVLPKNTRFEVERMRPRRNPVIAIRPANIPTRLSNT